MINKELIELQKGCNATCVVVKNEDIKELESKVLVKSTYNINDLLETFKEKINDKKYYQIIKDREFCGYKLPEDVVIVLTVKDKETLKNISKELYNLCVVAF